MIKNKRSLEEAKSIFYENYHNNYASIGEYQEKAIHFILKNYFENDNALMEVKLDGMIVDIYNEISDYKLIFTKLDETGSYGNLLNIKLYANAEDGIYLTVTGGDDNSLTYLDTSKYTKYTVNNDGSFTKGSGSHLLLGNLIDVSHLTKYREVKL